jgi:hypothetical protein
LALVGANDGVDALARHIDFRRVSVAEADWDGLAFAVLSIAKMFVVHGSESRLTVI